MNVLEITILGIPLANLTLAEAADWIVSQLKSNRQTFGVFINPEAVVQLVKNPQFKDAVLSATVRFADGVGLQWAAHNLSLPLKDNINGTDLFPLLCQRLDQVGSKIYFLGGGLGVAEKVAHWVGIKYPNIKVVGSHHGFFATEEEVKVVESIKALKPDLLLVGMGSPKQELWINKNLRDLPIKIAIGVGGLFDFYSGKVARAPQFFRELQLEWLWRLIREPWRLGRQLRLVKFVWLVLQEQFMVKSN